MSFAFVSGSAPVAPGVSPTGDGAGALFSLSPPPLRRVARWGEGPCAEGTDAGGRPVRLEYMPLGFAEGPYTQGVPIRL